ncbi:hypothetical protein ABE10_10580, partial [Bacillus toyonensis]|nr:hypothetical protein [Bacillus toyonensis]
MPESGRIEGTRDDGDPAAHASSLALGERGPVVLAEPPVDRLAESGMRDERWILGEDPLRDLPRADDELGVLHDAQEL